MKKLYTCTLAAVALLAGLTAEAAPRVAVRAGHARTEARAPHARRAHAPSARAEALTVAEIAGLYEWEYLTDTWSLEPERNMVTFKAGENDGEVIITGLWNQCEVKATFDSATGYLSIPAQEIDTESHVWFRRITEDPVNDEFVAMEGDYLTYLSGEDFVYEDGHLFGILDADGKVLLPSIDTNFFRTVDMTADLWTPLESPAKFADGWAAPAFTDPVEPYDVTIWQNKAVPTLYALVDPYGPGTPFADYNLDAVGKGFIVIDVTNPDCVFVKPRIFSGLVMDVEFEVDDNEYETFETSFYMWNQEQNLATLLDRSPEEIIAELEADGRKVSNLKDGVITLHNCIFGDQDDRLESYYFNEDSYAVVTLPKTDAVTEITAPAEAPAEYYNLQGMRVAAPVAGGIYIVRRDTATAKVRL